MGCRGYWDHPFLARLHALVDTPEMHQKIDLFYCTATETSYPDQLDALCKAAGVRLHRRITNADGPLDPAAVKLA